MPDRVPLSAAAQLPPWQQPKTLLFVLAVAMPLAFWVWSALLNNFVIEVGGFDGADIGWLHTIREIPGFLAVGVLAFLLFFHEQVFGLDTNNEVAIFLTIFMRNSLFSEVFFNYWQLITNRNICKLRKNFIYKYKE